MPTDSQVRGMLLEEALLYLLRVSGYRTLDNNAVHQDPTLFNGPNGLEVKGRGSKHQIDAIADFRVVTPFTYPPRLLVEAKCYRNTSPVGLEIIRNAVGVLKDVSERWISINSGGNVVKKRYHYQYAVFSASGYTEEAKMYAFAQDIYLISLSNSRFIQPLIRTIQTFNNRAVKELSASKEPGYRLKDLRQEIRKLIYSTSEFRQQSIFTDSQNLDFLNQFISEVKRMNGAILGTLGGQFPVFLTPNPDQNLWELRDSMSVRLHWDRKSWYISDEQGKPLFSFDLPTELEAYYTVGDILPLERALDLKSERLSEIQAILTEEDRIRILTLRLDMQWLNEVRQHLAESKRNEN